jgi:hypothetical protein
VVAPALARPLATAAAAQEVADSGDNESRPVARAASPSARPLFSDRRVVLALAGYERPARTSMLAVFEAGTERRQVIANAEQAGVPPSSVAAVPAEAMLERYVSGWFSPEVASGGTAADLPAVAAAATPVAPRLLSLQDLRAHAAALAGSLAVAAAGLYAYVRNRRSALRAVEGDEAAEPVEFRLRH